MTPQDFEALAPLYALDALDGEELAVFNEELKRSEPLRALVQEYRAAATALPLSLEPVAPSPAVRSRLLEAVAPAAPRSAPVFTRVFWAAAAVFLISLVVLGIRKPEDARRLPVNGMPDYLSVRGEALVRGRSIELLVAGLPKPPEGKVYQLWHIGDDKKPVGQGTFRLDPSGRLHGTDALKNPVGKDHLFAITLEPAGGSKAPTSPILAVGKY